MEGGNRLGKRLSRILLLLPYAIRNPGTTVQELSRRFDIPQEDLINDLNLVFLCGLPGYGPGDLIDVEFQDDRIFIHMADYFSAPLRLTPAEGLALYAGAQAIAALPAMAEAESLKRAVEKLGRALGAERDHDAAAIKVDLEGGPVGHMQLLQQALAERRRVEIEYVSSAGPEPTTRTVEPWGLVAARGRWYLVGMDLLRNDERMFRVDRMKSSRVLDEEAAVPDDFDPERYKGAFIGGDDLPMVTFEISPEAARWFDDYYPVSSSEELPDGWRRIQLASSRERWAATVALKLGKQVRNVRPDSVRIQAQRLARAIAARHAG
ncbi:MAG: helix-turn-helix transcriptional regulator [Actinomycetota bacterium]